MGEHLDVKGLSGRRLQGIPMEPVGHCETKEGTDRRVTVVTIHVKHRKIPAYK